VVVGAGAVEVLAGPVVVTPGAVAVGVVEIAAVVGG
jgi:hypothetical protein